MVYQNTGLPATIRFAPDGRLFVAEYVTGRVLVYTNPPFGSYEVWATLPLASGNSFGLTGMAFHPEYPDSPYVYFFHPNPDPQVHRVVRFTDTGTQGVDYTVIYDGLDANPADHHGGRIAFGPDECLYLTLGDGDHPDDAQDLSKTEGKILRMDAMGRIPADNPFGPGSPIVALGVRNPFGLAFDSATGAGYFTENGPNCDDELNLLASGVNYGWSNQDLCGEQPPGSFPAILTITPTIAPVGCCVYHGATYPQFDGNLFFGSYVDRAVHRVVFTHGELAVADTVEMFVDWPYPQELNENVLDVTTSPEGHLWVSTNTKIWRIEEPRPLQAPYPQAEPRAGLRVAPNPSWGSAVITLEGSTGFDRVEILDFQGRRVRTWSGSGTRIVLWDGRDDSGRRMGSGAYLVRAAMGSHLVTRRIVLLSR